MNSITTALALVFSVGLLTGCSGQKQAATTDPALKITEVVDLEECTDPQKNSLDTEGRLGNKPSDVNGGLCVNVTDTEDQATQAAFVRLRNVAAAGERASCQWADHHEDNDLVDSVWFCSPEEETGD